MVRVFISYSWHDKDFVMRLFRDLASKTVDVRIDDHALKVGDSMVISAHDEIAAADFVIVVISQNSLASKWVGIELAMAINKELKHEKTFILKLLIDSCEVFPQHSGYNP